MFDSFNDSPGNRKKTNLSSISPDELFQQVRLLFSLYICVLHKWNNARNSTVVTVPRFEYETVYIYLSLRACVLGVQTKAKFDNKSGSHQVLTHLFFLYICCCRAKPLVAALSCLPSCGLHSMSVISVCAGLLLSCSLLILCCAGLFAVDSVSISPG
jgi:hypothetical protein